MSRENKIAQLFLKHLNSPRWRVAPLSGNTDLGCASSEWIHRQRIVFVFFGCPTIMFSLSEAHSTGHFCVALHDNQYKGTHIYYQLASERLRSKSLAYTETLIIANFSAAIDRLNHQGIPYNSALWVLTFCVV